MTTSMVRTQLMTPASTPAAHSSPALDIAPAVAVAPLGTEPIRPSLVLVLAGLRRRALRSARAESAESDAIVALVAERAQSRADARHRHDEGGVDDDGGWG